MADRKHLTVTELIELLRQYPGESLVLLDSGNLGPSGAAAGVISSPTKVLIYRMDTKLTVSSEPLSARWPRLSD